MQDVKFDSRPSPPTEPHENKLRMGTAVIGLLASGCDLAYCLTFPLGAVLPIYLFLAAAGLFWMIWHLLVARILWQRAK